MYIIEVISTIKGREVSSICPYVFHTVDDAKYHFDNEAIVNIKESVVTEAKWDESNKKTIVLSLFGTVTLVPTRIEIIPVTVYFKPDNNEPTNSPTSV